jgi:hypothetical protein
MRRMIGCLVALALVGGAVAEDKKPPAASAKVVVAGKSSGLIQVSVTTSGETKKLQVTLVELDDKTTLAVALPPDSVEPPKKSDKDSGADPDLKRLLEAANAKGVAAEGRLSSTADALVIAAAGVKGAKAVPLLIAERVTDLTAANAKDFPPRGSVRVEGVLTRAAVKVGGGTADWAVRNEPNDIPLLLPAGTAAPDAGTRVRVAGLVNVVDGRFVVVVKKVEAVK